MNINKISINLDHCEMVYNICLEEYDHDGDYLGVKELLGTIENITHAMAYAEKQSKEMGIELLPFHNTDYVG